MSRRFVVEFSYSRFAVTPQDAAALVQIAERAVRLEGPGYGTPAYTVSADQSPFAESISLVEVGDLPFPAAPRESADAEPPAGLKLGEMPF